MKIIFLAVFLLASQAAIAQCPYPVETFDYLPDELAKHKMLITRGVNKLNLEYDICQRMDPATVGISNKKSEPGNTVFFVKCSAGQFRNGINVHFSEYQIRQNRSFGDGPPANLDCPNLESLEDKSSVPESAGTDQPVNYPESQNTYDSDDPCWPLYQLAERVMSARQAGAAMPRQMAIAKGSKLASAIVQEAYAQPRFGSEQYRSRAIQDFSNEVYAECLANVR